MRLAQFLTLATLALALLAAPLAAEAQQPGNVPRIGYLEIAPADTPIAHAMVDAFRQGMRERGYIEGQTFVIDYRAAAGSVERLQELVAELARLNVSVIVASATPAALAAKRAITTIPIVSAVMGDPVGDGLVASLARPGGNITGLTFLGPGLVTKRLQLLKEAVPGVSHVAALVHPRVYGEHTMQNMLKEAEVAAQTLGVQLQVVEASSPNDFDRAFSEIRTPAALVQFPSPMFYVAHTRLAELTAKHRLPAIFAAKENVVAGGLMSYGTNIPDLSRRAATYVDRILKGAKPADLPVEQPTKLELVINLKTAKALGLTIPPSADEVIR
jgi:ABC-type uncharacterized transport system substrate-binding protein